MLFGPREYNSVIFVHLKVFMFYYIVNSNIIGTLQYLNFIHNDSTDFLRFSTVSKNDECCLTMLSLTELEQFCQEAWANNQDPDVQS